MGDNKEFFFETLRNMNSQTAEEMKQINDGYVTNMTVLLNSAAEVEKKSQQNHERNMLSVNSNHVKNIAALDGARSQMYSNHELAMQAISDNTTSQLRAIENAKNNSNTGGILGLIGGIFGGGQASLSTVSGDKSALPEPKK